MDKTKNEYVLCAAIHYDDGEINVRRSCKNYPETGIVICGFRHSDIISILPINNRFRNDGKDYKCIQGFITSKGRFVSREEAYLIAKNQNQLLNDFEGKAKLFSEDIY